MNYCIAADKFSDDKHIFNIYHLYLHSFYKNFSLFVISFLFSILSLISFFFFFSSRRRHTRWNCDWSSDMCSSDLERHQQRRERHDDHRRDERAAPADAVREPPDAEAAGNKPEGSRGEDRTECCRIEVPCLLHGRSEKRDQVEIDAFAQRDQGAEQDNLDLDGRDAALVDQRLERRRWNSGVDGSSHQGSGSIYLGMR